MKSYIRDKNFRPIKDAKTCFQFNYKGYQISSSNYMTSGWFEVVIFADEGNGKAINETPLSSVEDAIEHIDQLVFANFVKAEFAKSAPSTTD